MGRAGLRPRGLSRGPPAGRRPCPGQALPRDGQARPRRPGRAGVQGHRRAARPEVAEFGRRWCAEVSRRCGLLLFVWTHLHFAAEGHCDGLSAYPLWIADPGRPAGQPRVPAPWTDWAIQQYAGQPRSISTSSRAPWPT